MQSSEVSHKRPDSVYGLKMIGEDAVRGIVHVIREEAELDKFREGEILVAAEVPENWSHLFSLAKAIITGTDDLPTYISDAATTYDLCVVTGVQRVTSDLRSGDIVMIHTDGKVERLQERREPDSRMRVSVPAAVHARQFAEQLVAAETTDPSAPVVSLKMTERLEPDARVDARVDDSAQREEVEPENAPQQDALRALATREVKREATSGKAGK